MYTMNKYFKAKLPKNSVLNKMNLHLCWLQQDATLTQELTLNNHA